MKHFKIVMCIALMFTIFYGFTNVYGTDMLNTIINSGGNWFNNTKPNANSLNGIENLSNDISDFIKGDILKMVFAIGNLIFFVAAAFLGVKYIWSGVSGKSDVKETLPTFFVGVTFFYSSQLIYKFFDGEFRSLVTTGNFQTMSGTIWSTITVIVQILAISGVIAVGLKYMLAPANTKADIKKDLMPVLLGLIFVFSISSLMTFLANIGKQLFQ